VEDDVEDSSLLVSLSMRAFLFHDIYWVIHSNILIPLKYLTLDIDVINNNIRLVRKPNIS
jgi:hypothetical protein